MFVDLLDRADAARATAAVEAVLRHGVRGALTGGLAVEAQLRRCGRPAGRRQLHDIDLVVESFASIPDSVAGSFLQPHVHPDATEGRTLLQLVDEPRRLRIDLFKALGTTLARARPLSGDTGDLDVLSVEDLVARSTALVCGRLRRSLPIDVKHVAAFTRLRGLGAPATLAAAWHDHRQQVPGTLDEASREAARLLETHPELVVVERYSSEPVGCASCRPHGAFRPAPAHRVIEILGYC